MRTVFESALTALPASIPAPVWSGFDIPLPTGTLRIHAYALCILAGIIAATAVTYIRWTKRRAPEGSIWDIAIWAIPMGIIGGRLYHVFSSPDAYFGPGYRGGGDLWLIPQIWRGGLGIWGAVVLGVVGAWIGCRRAGVKLPAFIDAAAPGLLLAQGLGRWGNYFNQELFGGPTTLPWGLQVDPSNVNFPVGYAADTLFHPTFLYESLWDLAGVALLLLLDRRFHFRRGRLFWLYAMYYTLGRVWIELLRIDDAEQITFFGITTRLNVWTSILVFVVSAVIFLVLTFYKGKGNNDTVLLAGREPVAVHNGDSEGGSHVGSGGASAIGANGGPEVGADGGPEVGSDTGSGRGPGDGTDGTGGRGSVASESGRAAAAEGVAGGPAGATHSVGVVDRPETDDVEPSGPAAVGHPDVRKADVQKSGIQETDVQNVDALSNTREKPAARDNLADTGDGDIFGTKAP
ncbi:prolipoprotein diacylglyceryl transferase [Paeniglutamicibacter antarcticus]|uniref:Phosphatidylglycerol--prolipoprotein diacylglyceryl transferase n=1 Tax=Arthrobacter terrae TaxID=2935737 RepID=A0A931G8Z3_9MICC|nr:prolipoprotein diacylglyceryl transferase [Arthrobacter terrae]MBG0740684.1 prolipoprotein diacylglyceryl transferase [Arthrobacter terrae]